MQMVKDPPGKIETQPLRFQVKSSGYEKMPGIRNCFMKADEKVFVLFQCIWKYGCCIFLAIDNSFKGTISMLP